MWRERIWEAFCPPNWPDMIQAHHLVLDYYDKIYVGGYSQSQADHERLWHG